MNMTTLVALFLQLASLLADEWPLLLACLVVDGLIWLVSNGLASFFREKVTLESLTSEKSPLKKSGLVGSFIILLLSLLLGVCEMAHLYLFSGAYPWLLILSLGLYAWLFIFPFYSLTILSALKKQRKFGVARWISLTLIVLWIILLVTSDNFIYTDEGGVGREPINVLWKNVAIVLLIANVLVQTVYIALFKIRSLSSKKADELS